MCGIALIIRKDSSRISDSMFRKYVSILEQSLSFRGPDGSNIVAINDNISLVHTRLSINGLGDGQQPFFHHQTRKCISAVNGEIYNYPVLRNYYGISQLATSSDCEVLGHGYSLLGSSSFNKLDGMFAGIVADLDNQTLSVVRDSFGEKPLFIYEDNQLLIISSAVKSIVNCVNHNGNRLTLSRRNLQMFLRYQFIPCDTVFNEIREIQAGTISKFCFDGTLLSRKSLDSSFENLDLISTLGKSVERVALSEVPIATTLSGGMDSALIHFFLSQIKVPLSPYTIDNETTGSEWGNAKITADACGYKSVQLSIPDDYFLDYLDNKYPLLDSPFGDITSAAYYFLCEQAKSDGNKVILFGHGLDEFFFGYKWVNEAAMGRLVASHRRSKCLERPSILGLFDCCPYVVNTRSDFEILPLHTDHKILSPDDIALSAIDVKKSISNLYMRKNGLLQLDNISMQVGIEARSPFVCSQLSDLADSLFENLPDQGKLATLQSSKLAVRNLVSQFIPGLHHTLEKKKGFSPDVNKWHKIIKSRYKENWGETYLSANNLIGDSYDVIESMNGPACRVLFFLDQHLSSFNFNFNLN